MPVIHTLCCRDGVEILGVSTAQPAVPVVSAARPIASVSMPYHDRGALQRRDDPASITVVGLGMELSAATWVEDWNKLRKGKDAVNRIRVIELRTDPKYGALRWTLRDRSET